MIKKMELQVRIPIPESRTARPGCHSEEDIESRLRNLGHLVEGLCDAAYLTLLTERTHVREALEELLVKEAAMRWIVRVAKHSNGPIREALWSDIEKSLTDLEKTAESVMHTDVN